MAKRKRKSQVDTKPRKQAKQATTSNDAQSSSDATNMATTPACKAVLETTELLENILVNLPGLQLFTIQRVSRHFKETVNKSPQIQIKMFLRPQEPRDSWMVIGHGHKWLPEGSQVAPGEASSIFPIVRENNLAFSALSRYLSQRYSRHYGQWGLHGERASSVNLTLRRSLFDQILRRSMTERQSWEDMHIADPPPTAAQIRGLYINTGDTTVRFERTIKDAAGLKLGTLFRETIAEVRTKAALPYNEGSGKDKRLTRKASKELISEGQELPGFPILQSFGSGIIRLSDVWTPSDDEREEFKLKGSATHQRGFSTYGNWR